MSEPQNQPPDRLCMEERSPYYNMEIAKRVDIWINGEKHDDTVVEYSVSGRWARVLTKLPDGTFAPNFLRNRPKISRKQNLDIRVEWKSGV